jgi:RNA polymerase sigma factor (sigma-70 family)
MAATETSARANAVLDELYREHVGEVYRYTYAVLGNHADAEDVTQTTFVNALRALERGETPEDPSRWLTVIAHNLVRQRWRQAAARPTLVELETDVADAEEDENAFELEELVRALQRIPETQREAIVMRELEGRSYREIATVMGLSTAALETLLFRARRSLAEELENVVTCQNAELALSKRLDGRLSRKERRRLEEHLADCPDCARLAATQQRQRRAFKGLALLPLPIGLALFKGAPSAAAATTLPTIGLGSAGTGTSGAGAAAATTTGGAAVGGSLAGGLALKVAAVVVTATVAVGVGYKGVQSVRHPAAETPKADVKKATTHETGAPAVPITPRVTREAEVKKAPVEAKRHGKPASSPGRAKHDLSPQPGLATSQSAHAAGNNAGNASSAGVGTGAKPHPAGGTGPKHVGSPAKSNAPAPGATNPAAPKGGAGPALPKAPSGGGAGGAGSGNAKGGASGGNVSGGNPSGGNPSAGNPSGGGQAASAQGGTTAPAAAAAPTTSGAATGPPSQPQDPGSATPPASDPTTDPTTQPPTQETPPSTPPSTGTGDPSSGSTGGSSGDDDSSGNNGSNGAENGEKNGHHKGNHDGRHPEDS